MKKYLLSTAAVAMVALAAPASAADLAARPYTKAPAYAAPAAPIYNWTGFYIGGHIGGGFPGEDNVVLGNRDGTFLGGVQGGWDTQFAPNWVFGLEANYSFKDTSSSFDNRGLGSVTGRLGYTWGPTLLYAKGGYAWADSRFTNGFGGDGGRDGYTVGGGLEYLFTQNWSGKIEYQYYDFGNVTAFGPGIGTVVGFKNDEHTVKAGLNYRFNLGNLGGGFVQ
ncbi:outer membrane protein [Tardiphaga sp.]|jgi:outer membrane immunogenic protein|uniref:outer membrane protein n=1 Tax=Tardiphaga sp. TaxID=1926292 RepID=UPI0037D9B7BA